MNPPQCWLTDALRGESHRLDFTGCIRGRGFWRQRGLSSSTGLASLLCGSGSCGPGTFSDQRPVRLPSQCCAGSGNPAPSPASESELTISGNTPPENLFRDCSLIRAGFPPIQQPSDYFLKRQSWFAIANEVFAVVVLPVYSLLMTIAADVPEW